MTPQSTRPIKTLPDVRLPQRPRLFYACPHCGGELDLQACAPLSSTATKPEMIAGLDEKEAGEGRAGGQWLTRLGERFFPLSSALFSPQPPERARVGIPPGRTQDRRLDCPRYRPFGTQKNELKPWLKQEWKIPPKANAAFVAQMEDVLCVYAQPRRAGARFERRSDRAAR
jgi:hypothetical protein